MAHYVDYGDLYDPEFPLPGKFADEFDEDIGEIPDDPDDYPVSGGLNSTGALHRGAAALAAAMGVYNALPLSTKSAIKYVAAGVGSSALRKGMDWMWPGDRGKKEVFLGGGQGRRRMLGTRRAQAIAQAKSRISSGQSFASQSEKQRALDEAIAAEKSVNDEYHKFEKSYDRSFPMGWGHEQSVPLHLQDEWKSVGNEQATRYTAQLREARRRVATLEQTPIETPKALVEGRDHQMRRYARDHRRRMRAVRYAKQLPAERFLAAYGASRGVRKGMNYHR